MVVQLVHNPKMINGFLVVPIMVNVFFCLLCSAIEMFIKHNPVCVNLQKDDGYTPLHLAALNNHLDVLTTILDSVCFINFLIFVMHVRNGGTLTVLLNVHVCTFI